MGPLIAQRACKQIRPVASFFAALWIVSFVESGMYRASDALLRTIETVVEAKPLSVATSRRVTTRWRGSIIENSR
jgi:hypothetical protein